MAPVAFIGQPGEALPDVPAPAPEPSKEAKPTPASTPHPDTPIHQYAAPASVAPQPVPALAPAKAVSPRAKRLAKESAVSYEPINGTGPGGRVIEKDVRNYLAAKKYDELKITPAAKALAVKENIDVLGMESDEPGRITVEDIQRAAAEKPQEMSRMRQIIAQRLAGSFSSAPHFYVTVSVDMTALLEFRKTLRKENKSYSVTDFILKACAAALRDFPAVNSAIDEKNARMVRRHARVHLGLAVDIKEGLVVPVIRNADTISLTELHERVMALAAKARDGKLKPAEMTGGTFTVSNMGMLNVENFTAIINPGESAILAVSSVIPAPTAVKNEIKIRSMMKITLSSDHRLVDGALAARFINRIKDLLEDTQTWASMVS
jgi:pyruvate dehydrogenase E2 component (dihydrolipoamide acetyltransferase)